MGSINISEVLKKAVQAIDKEIEAVLERPSEEILYKGVFTDGPSGTFRYVFPCTNPSIQYAEKVLVECNGKQAEAVPLDYSDQKITLGFEDSFGKEIATAHLSWENDFILRCIKSRLLQISETDEASGARIARMLSPEEVSADENPDIINDGLRNSAQVHAMKMAVSQPVSFIWGPPGTGKTATLGFIIASYLKAGKRVLFASNTNRAVDIGVLSTIQALLYDNPMVDLTNCTRFGESVISDQRLDQVLFEHQIEKFLAERKDKAVSLATTLDQWRSAEKEIEQKIRDGYHIDEAQEHQLIALQQAIQKHGGAEALEEKIADLATRTHATEFRFLRKKNLVAATLAKVCTSELLHDAEFDAVVVDESSMASLPFLLVLAAMARKHLVLVGDPMQLPPIAITSNFEARSFLEQDIYALLSGARTIGEYFEWHDKNPGITAFFDVQFRLKEDLADIISDIFYEGRLKTHEKKSVATNGKKSLSAQVIDSSPLIPEIIQDNSRAGFRPVNKVHHKILEELLRKLVQSGHARQEDIGIIVPFRSSVWTVRQMLRDKGFGEIEVGTIHTFQGREKEVIVFDTVMAADAQHGFPRHYSVRPFDEDKNGLAVPRLLNVAFSRCKQNMFVIADMNHIQKVYSGKFLHRLLMAMGRFSLERLGLSSVGQS